MSLLDNPDAQALPAGAALTPEAVRGCQHRLTCFLERYLPRFHRAEQRANAALVLRGRLSGLQRKTCEPIAVEAGVHRKPIQFLVGAGKWDDEAVMAEVRRHVAEELADPQAVIVIDATTFPKSGGGSCGVARQWCGRLGEQENRQLGRSWPTPPPAATPRWTGGCTCRRTGPATRCAGRSATCPGRSPSGRSGESPRTSSSGAARACPTAGWPGTTSSAARPASAPGPAGSRSGTRSMCRATR